MPVGDIGDDARGAVKVAAPSADDGEMRGARALVGIVVAVAGAVAPVTTAAGPAVRPAAAAAGRTWDGAVEYQLAVAFNAERRKVGLPPLSHNPALQAVQARPSALHSANVRTLVHDRALMSNVRRAIPSAGRAGEIIAACCRRGTEASRTAWELLNMWMSSPPHRAIVLGRFGQNGIGVLRDRATDRVWAAVGFAG